MSKEETIQNRLQTQFDFLTDKVRVQRARRLWLEVDYGRFRPVLEYAIGSLGFNLLCTLTGLDDGDRLGLIYHIADPEGTVLNIKTSVSMQDPVFNTITDLFPAAEDYEKEIVDLLGGKVLGLKPGFRYPLTDDWPADQHPLRKSWKQPAKGAENV